MTINLPFDILTAILDELEDFRDIWHIRTANRTLKRPKSWTAFGIPDIAAHVRQVTFHHTDTDRWGRPLNDDDGQRSGLDSSALAHQDPVLQTSILDALATSFNVRAPKLTSLSLHNLRTSDLSLLESPSFQTTLMTLLRLQLSVLFDHSPGPDTDLELERWCNFWGTLCPRMVLTPTQHSLTELTLHSDTYVGALCGLSFAGLHFPRLCALSLRMVVFEPSVGATQFILRHAATLARLELLLCKLLDTYPSTAHARDEESSPEPHYWEYI
ncbi:hypothetical protein EDB83DRAFT_2679220 [Lactarius deliciosus]|nr:hypothetical protein EDB83DRAFT_2679220 [Lactarius deliciosus]